MADPYAGVFITVPSGERLSFPLCQTTFPLDALPGMPDYVCASEQDAQGIANALGSPTFIRIRPLAKSFTFTPGAGPSTTGVSASPSVPPTPRSSSLVRGAVVVGLLAAVVGIAYYGLKE